MTDTLNIGIETRELSSARLALPTLPGPDSTVQVSVAAAAHLLGKLAFLVIDVQSYYCDPSVPDSGGTKETDRVAGDVQSVIPEFRKAGVPIIAVHFTEDDEPGARDPSKIDFYKYQPAATDILVRKKTRSAFKSSDIHDLLKKRGIEHLLVAGVYLDQCVNDTAMDALGHEYKVTLLEDITWRDESVCKSIGHGEVIRKLKNRGADVTVSRSTLADIKKARGMSP